MRLVELIFQGVFGNESAARLQLGDDVSRTSLPDGISVDDARSILLNLLYPTNCRGDERQVIERSDDPRLALVLRAQGTLFRIIRKGPTNSVRLQVQKEGTWATVVEGVSEVEEFLDERAGRPSLRVFRALNLWDFEGAARETPADFVDPNSLGPEASQMVDEYEKALEIDEIEKKLEKLDQKIQEYREKYGKGLKVEEKLEQAKEKLESIDLSDIRERDLDLLREKKERIENYESELERLDRDEDEERKIVEELEPESPWNNNALWAGLVFGFAAIALSFFYSNSVRWVALFDSVGFGVVAWIFLKYLTDREKVNIHKVRIESIKRRVSEVRREMVEFQEKVDHLLVHQNADDEIELLDRYRKSERLEGVVEDLEKKAEKLASNETYQRARKRLDELEERRRKLKQRRDELPAYGADLFHLENELRALGIDPKAAIAAREDQSAGEGEDVSPFEFLSELAEELGYVTAGTLDKKPLKLWRKMARHVLDDGFSDVAIDENGEIQAESFREADDFGEWLGRHPDEARMLAGTLALAIHLRSVSRDRRVDTVWLEEPRDRYPAAIAEGLLDVLRGAKKRAHFVLNSGA